MVRRRLTSGGALLVALILVAGLSSRLTSPIPIARAAPALEGTPDEQLTAAADKLVAATAKGGSGFTFTVVSRSTLYQKEGGPLIEVPDPIDREKSLGFATSYETGILLATGIVTPDGFAIDLRAGSPGKDTAPDFAAAPILLRGLLREGTKYRDDGEGWYVTDGLPGIGLDPDTIARLPTLLREATGPTDTGTVGDGTATLERLEAAGSIEHAPGLLAIDAGSFSELRGPLAFDLDAEGRLARLSATIRNTRQEEFDLLVEVVVVFDWSAAVPALPEPVPLIEPEVRVIDAGSEGAR